jgi:hypothetical protein
VKSIAVQSDNPEVIFAGGYYRDESADDVPSVMKTTDGGDTWDEIGLSITRKITKVCIDPFNSEKIYAGTEKKQYTNIGGVYVSTDGGTTWQDPVQHFFVHELIPDLNQEGRLYAGTEDGVFISSNSGLNWEVIGEGLDQSITSLDLDPINNVLYAGTEDKGVFRLSLGTSVRSLESLPPASIALYQNFPNPFNAVTTLKIRLSRARDIRLVVFDVQGRLVRVLYEGRQRAGLHLVTWDGLDNQGMPVPSGLYIARLNFGTQIQMKKMILQK